MLLLFDLRSIQNAFGTGRRAQGEGHIVKTSLVVAGAVSRTSYCNHDDDNDSKDMQQNDQTFGDWYWTRKN